MVDNQQLLAPVYEIPCTVDVNIIRNNDDAPPLKNMQSEEFANLVYCSNCELNFIDGDEYEGHKCRKKHSCTFCNTSFQRYDHLKRHIQSLHSNTKYNICPVCNKDCKGHELLLKHIKTHPNESEAFNCRNCEQECKSLHELVMHECRHIWPESHVCTHCSKIFKRRDHMLRHIQTLHLQQYTVCPICNQKFKRKDHAVRHIREKHKMVISNGKLKEFQAKLANIQQ